MAGWVEFDTDDVLAGFALSSARGPGEVLLEIHGFYTSDDGPRLYELLDHIYRDLLSRGSDLPPEQIKSALISIKHRHVAMLINPRREALVVTTRSVEKDATPRLDDLADVVSLRFPEVDLPTEGSLIFIFQHQWRHGLYFDFRHVHDPHDAPPSSLGDVSALLGSLWGALLHRDRIRMEESVLTKMAADGWFPFTRLSTQTVIDLYRHYELGWDPAEIVTRIEREISPQLSNIVENWSSKPAFAPHMSVLRDAARLFSQGEHRAAATMVLPKVEGVLRHIYAGTKARPQASDLHRELIGRVRSSVMGYTALLPERFIAYLESYYYASFNLATGNIPPSRNAFAHGVGPDEKMLDPHYALRLFLMLDQVFFCLSRMQEPVPSTG